MKNSDVKLMASAANRQFHALAAETPPEQQGFVNGRQFLRNVVGVDAAARRHSLSSNAATDKPVF
eukprot:2701743-Pyramimonas_sp.AAC.1